MVGWPSGSEDAWPTRIDLADYRTRQRQGKPQARGLQPSPTHALLKSAFSGSFMYDFALGMVVAAAVLMAAGVLYQILGCRHDRLLYANDGRWVTIGRGLRLYLLEKGSGGAYGSIRVGNRRHQFELAASSGNGGAVYGDGVVRPRRTGMEQPCRTPRTPGNIAVELHAMVERAGSSRRSFWWDIRLAGW